MRTSSSEQRVVVEAVTIMQNAFFENTYSSFVRMYYQKTFDAMLATPLSLADVITGEIVWCATRSAIAATLMLVAITPFALLSHPSSLLVIPPRVPRRRRVRVRLIA